MQRRLPRSRRVRVRVRVRVCDVGSMWECVPATRSTRGADSGSCLSHERRVPGAAWRRTLPSACLPVACACDCGLRAEAAQMRRRADARRQKMRSGWPRRQTPDAREIPDDVSCGSAAARQGQGAIGSCAQFDLTRSRGVAAGSNVARQRPDTAPGSKENDPLLGSSASSRRNAFRAARAQRGARYTVCYSVRSVSVPRKSQQRPGGPILWIQPSTQHAPRPPARPPVLARRARTLELQSARSGCGPRCTGLAVHAAGSCWTRPRDECIHKAGGAPALRPLSSYLPP